MSSEPVRPLPVVDGEAREFWQAAARHELVLQECRSCGRRQHYPRALCHHCWSTELTWVPSTGRGEVHSFTIVHRPPTPAFGELVPYVIALVDLDDGVRMLSHVIDADPDHVTIGMRVTVAFEDVTDEVSLPVFRPA